MSYDFAVIGGGSAGYAAARTAADEGLRAVVVEGGADVGGLCILRGCMPSKALIASANVARTVNRAESFGIHTAPARANLEEIIDRKRRLIGEFADYRREQLEAGRFDFIRGWAKMLSPTKISVTPQDGGEAVILEAKSVLLSTGSTHALPDIPGLREAKPLTSDDILEGTKLADSIIVLGAGPVALEMAHYLDSIGKKITIIQRSPQVLRGIDADIAGVVETAFRKRGIEVFTGTELLAVERSETGVTVTFKHQGVTRTCQAADLLNGLGRQPATAGLGLEDAGIELDGPRIGTGKNQQTNVPTVFAAGDCSGPFEVVHIAVTQGEIAARNAARVLKGESATEETDYRLYLYAIFTDPEVGSVGLSETTAKERGIPYLAASYPFDDHGKSLVSGHTEGFVKLLCDPESREIIGGSVVGPEASDLIHEIVVAMAFHSTAGQLAAIPHYHPTLSEIWTYPAEELADA